MSKKRHFLASLATAVLLSTLANTAQAEAPDRVPRCMMIWNSSVPLDWDAEGSVAMVVMPRVVEETNTKISAKACYTDFYGNLDYEPRVYKAIEDTLMNNLADRIVSGEIKEEEIPIITELVLDAMDNRTWYLRNEVTHVAKGGATRLTNVYFDSIPPNGAMAQAGPDGDVMVLGKFWVHKIFPHESLCNPGAGEFVVTASPETYSILLAIGWFTK